MIIKPTGKGCTFGLFTDDHGDGCEQIQPGDEVFMANAHGITSSKLSRYMETASQ